ncbi:hypothetical protein NYR77_00875 [Actinobacillus equuli subsp. haemolyticus]|uniref:Uncharacterized protein n=3 Tax=Actinobacillus TaxID=713 RepID=K0G2F2_ACTSU|nr:MULTISPECIES: hypothetical protein [Actinobacillus]AFU18338.1 hypothetical protein ASU2_00980 [Actinobacillus suis H91-0380]AIJ30474.1 hypothetical protein ASU1_00985 [Actinobacillus suis ATCC 33415]AIZ78349.1 hypothetical protein ACEE_00830 [Actinobacillus equuli subsp. equuli]MCO4167375.1 hypothetical protein [Actinobacillus suis]MCO4168966.1 hypothetical protein [Actinobacillus suis]
MKKPLTIMLTSWLMMGTAVLLIVNHLSSLYGSFTIPILQDNIFYTLSDVLFNISNAFFLLLGSIALLKKKYWGKILLLAYLIPMALKNGVGVIAGIHHLGMTPELIIHFSVFALFSFVIFLLFRPSVNNYLNELQKS